MGSKRRAARLHGCVSRNLECGVRICSPYLLTTSVFLAILFGCYSSVLLLVHTYCCKLTSKRWTVELVAASHQTKQEISKSLTVMDYQTMVIYGNDYLLLVVKT